MKRFFDFTHKKMFLFFFHKSLNFPKHVLNIFSNEALLCILVWFVFIKKNVHKIPSNLVSLVDYYFIYASIVKFSNLELDIVLYSNFHFHRIFPVGFGA